MAQEVRNGEVEPPLTTLSMTAFGARRIVSFRVARSYRGNIAETVTVTTGLGGGDCGFDFDTGGEYLVYAFPDSTGSLHTGLCSGTQSISTAGADLRYLRGEPPAAVDLMSPSEYQRHVYSEGTGTVCGLVTKPDGRALGKASIDISLVREKFLPLEFQSDPNLSSADGTFCIKSIRPGKYLLTAESYNFDESTRWMGFYPGVAEHSLAQTLEIHAGTRLTNLRFTVQQQALFTVRFRIVGPHGDPIQELKDWGSLSSLLKSIGWLTTKLIR